MPAYEISSIIAIIVIYIIMRKEDEYTIAMLLLMAMCAFTPVINTMVAISGSVLILIDVVPWGKVIIKAK